MDRHTTSIMAAQIIDRALSIIPRDIMDEAPIHNCRSDYRLQARVLSIIPREIIDEAPIYNSH